MSKNIVFALIALSLIAAGLEYVRVAERERALQDAASDLLANWHPRYLAGVRKALAAKAAALDLGLRAETVKLSKVPSKAQTLAARALGNRARSFAVRIEAPYTAEWLGFSLERTLVVQRAVTTDGVDAPAASETQRGAGNPLPIFVD